VYNSSGRRVSKGVDRRNHRDQDIAAPVDLRSLTSISQRVDEILWVQGFVGCAFDMV
jgi:hypothetical protein